MIILLLESSANVIMPFYEQLDKYYPSSSKGVINSRDRADEIVTKFSKAPLFTRGWLINCRKGANKSALKKLEAANPNNQIVIQVTNTKDLDAEMTRLSGLNVSIVNNLRLEYSEVIDWICGELGCNWVIADKIYKRTSGQLKALVDAVSTLCTFDSLSEYDVVRFVPKALKFGVGDLFLWLVRQPPRAMKVKDAIQIVYDYQYGTIWLINYLCEQTAEYLEVFVAAMSGELTLVNYRRYRQDTGNKKISQLSEYKLRRILETFGKVSYEYLLWLYNTLQTLNPRSQLVCYKLLQLVKISGQY